MPPITPFELYHRFVTIIDQAGAENIYAVPEAAEAAGMTGGEEPRTMGQRWNYSLTDGLGTEILVHARWFDSSKPFANGPDIHIMRVEFKDVASQMAHERRYKIPLFG